jgi:endonuclease/exonuclease/phosphatase (EEP) superfamily protein YafD
MEFTVTSFNVHNDGILTDFSAPYDLSGCTAPLAGEIRVFQEVGDHPHIGARLELPADFELHSLAVFPNLAQVPGQDLPPLTGNIVVATTFPLLERREIPVPAAGRDPRNCVLALRLDVGGTPLWFVGVHLTTGLLPFGSFRQLRALRPLLPEGPMVIAGDHNLWYPPSQLLLGSSFKPAVRGKTWPAHRPRHQIDHIWARGVDVLSGELLPATPSDHLPITARLRLGS